MITPQIPNFSEKARENLGKQYSLQIEDAISGREKLMRDTWDRALEHYEGKSRARDWPWKYASNAIIPIIPTHTDAIEARLYNTCTGQDPKFLISPWGTGEMASGWTVEDFTKEMQRLSKYLEREELPVDDILELAIKIMTKYGDSILYIPWEQEEDAYYELNEDGTEWEKQEGGYKVNKPVVKVVHPKDFIIPIYETGVNAVQEARFIGYRYVLTPQMLELYTKNGFYDEKCAKELRKSFYPDEEKKDNEQKDYFPTGGDGRIYTPEEFQRRREERVGLARRETEGQLEMYHIFAREDLDGDGIAEDVEFHIHRWSGRVPRITYPAYHHRKRPFVQLSYAKRDGVFYSMGVPEMLFNVADVLNTTIRDILDNNKIQNTKAFLVRIGSGLQEGFRAYPGRMIFVNNIETDFRPIDMGSGGSNTSVGDLATMQSWGERRTGISDFNLGQEKTGRTPATTTLALLEEANKRIDLVVRRLRVGLEEFWSQVLQLYMQYGSADLARAVEGVEGSRILEETWSALTTDEIRKRVVIRSQASTQNLNRAIRRQESMALFGQLQVWYEMVERMATMLSQTTDPSFRELYTAFLEGGREVMTQFYDSFDIKSQDNVNPNFVEMVKDAVGGAPNFGIVEEAAGSRSQVDTALQTFGKLGDAGGPTNPPGRPVAGTDRVPTGAGGGSGQFGFDLKD